MLQKISYNKKISRHLRFLQETKDYRLSRYHSSLWIASYTQRIRNSHKYCLRTLISSPYNGGPRLYLLFLRKFSQKLQGEFHNFLLLPSTNRQLSVIRSLCTIPYQRIYVLNYFMDIDYHDAPSSVKINLIFLFYILCFTHYKKQNKLKNCFHLSGSFKI